MNVDVLVQPTTIKLDPIDWHWATWRDYTPPPKPTPKPFDQEATLVRLSKIKSAWWDTGSPALKLPLTMTPQEAHFWLTAFCLGLNWQEPASNVLAKLASLSFNGQLSVEAIEQMIMNARYTQYNNDYLVPVSYTHLTLPTIYSV